MNGENIPISYTFHGITIHADVKNKLYFTHDTSIYSNKISNKIYDELKSSITFEKDIKLRIHGREVTIPRKQTAYGDDGISYGYSGIRIPAKPWIPILLEIKNAIELLSGKNFNFCLVNYYHDGTQYIGPHKDDERELQSGSYIVSVTFGQERIFRFTPDDPKIPKVDIKLPNGCILMILPPTNRFWKHSVPKKSKNLCPKPRFNLTFRSILID